ncbi:hypothetical protein HYC85_030352 [Camellia sinensis]|uniref:Uncharacterized protein n=1 Tax=Camellia sinensis TaxID=4442 RepID=A0A7J7G201_CAMSI|nr:hypothetical protein HYC85_030352 [Camellia sinensis]
MWDKSIYNLKEFPPKFHFHGAHFGFNFPFTRAAAVEASSSTFLENENDGGRIILNEAQATVQLGKLLGVEYNGMEEEVLSKIVELERKDKERIEGGIRRKEKIGKIRKLMKDKNIDFVVLRETKKVVITEKVTRAMWMRNEMAYMEVDLEGVAGGTLCIWDPVVF